MSHEDTIAQNTAPAASDTTAENNRQFPYPWTAVAVVMVGHVLDILDSLVTTIAGPTIQRDLGGSDALIQWLAAGYTMAMAAGLLVGGRLGDKYGRKAVFQAGLAGFTCTSLLSAVAWSPQVLITARVVQGMVGALMLPQALGIIKEVAPPGKLGFAFGLTGPIKGISAVAGPILAGWLVDANFFNWSWRMIFAINIPIGAVALIVGAFRLPRNQPDPNLKLDWLGTLLACTGMAAVLYPLVQGRELGWPGWSFAVLGAGLLMIVIFGAHQRARHARGKSTLVLPTLFARGTFTAGLTAGLFFFSATMGSALLYSLFLQLGLGLTPLGSGLATIAQAFGLIVGFIASNSLGMTRRTMLTGTFVVMLGLAATIATVTWQQQAIHAWMLSPSLLLTGIGMGMALAPYFEIVLTGIADDELGSAAGTLSTVQQLGAALGVAVLGTTYFSTLSHFRGNHVHQHLMSLQWSLAAAAGFVLLALLLTLRLPRRADRSAEEVESVAL